MVFEKHNASVATMATLAMNAAIFSFPVNMAASFPLRSK